MLTIVSTKSVFSKPRRVEYVVRLLPPKILDNPPSLGWIATKKMINSPSIICEMLMIVSILVLLIK